MAIYDVPSGSRSTGTSMGGASEAGSVGNSSTGIGSRMILSIQPVTLASSVIAAGTESSARIALEDGSRYVMRNHVVRPLIGSSSGTSTSPGNSSSWNLLRSTAATVNGPLRY